MTLVNKTKRCGLCRQDVRRMIWTKPEEGRIEVWAVCPACDSSAFGGPLSQQPEAEAQS